MTEDRTANDVMVKVLYGETLPDVLREAASWIETNSVVNIWHIVTENRDHVRLYAIYIYFFE